VCFGSEILVDDEDTLWEILGDSFDELVTATAFIALLGARTKSSPAAD
jgi:hypothetical protein